MNPMNNGNKGWLTTFGDMLTLLLCFFISTISLGPLTNSDQSKTEPNSEVVNTGTQIAKAINNSPFRFVDLQEDGFTATGQVDLEDLKSKIEKQIDPAVYKVKRAKVEACFIKPDTQEGHSWHMSMTRVLALGRQLIDAAIVAEPARLRSLGPWCEVIRGYDTGSQVTARLILEVEEIAHG